ncbi:MAG: radical SAM-associated putative lipoprotein [Paludibacter sp.]|nr:radical SAM-associated putative lipoprotein [Paludibacter sp.]
MKKFIKISTKICGALLAVLGFSALATSCKYGVIVPNPAYGMPSADYFIDGKVVSEQTEEPIKDLKIRFVGQIGSDYHPIDSVFSDENGEFNFVRQREFPLTSYSLDIQDVDGDLNGAFNDTTVNVQIENDEYQGSDGEWYFGTYRKTFDIKLEQKD